MTTNKQLFNLLKKNKNWILDLGDLRIYENNQEYCPLTYACKVKFKEEFDVGDYFAAAQKLGISVLRAKAIVKAADNLSKTKSQRKLRKQLLKTLNLKENENV
jgi:hypothetical protein